jgi:hypothetical protein
LLIDQLATAGLTATAGSFGDFLCLWFVITPRAGTIATKFGPKQVRPLAIAFDP